MANTVFCNPNSDSGSVCSETRLSLYEKSEWATIRTSKNYKISITLVADNIVWLRPSGYAKTSDLRRALDFTKNFRAKVLPGNGPYIQIDDWSNLKGSSFRARKFYIRDLRRRKRLLGLVYYASPPALRIAIQLGKRFKIFAFTIEIAQNFSDAVSLAHKILSGNRDETNKFPFDSPSNQMDFEPDRGQDEAVIADSTWQYKTDNFAMRVETINTNVLHGITAGRIKVNQMEPCFQLLEEVAQTSNLPPDSYYHILGLDQSVGIGQKERKLYVTAILEFYKKYPFQMLIFYGVNRLLRAAINMSRPFAPFRVRVAKDLNSALNLIEDQNRRVKNPLYAASRKKNIKKFAKDDQINQYVTELLKFLEEINWEVDGLNPDRQKDPSHPFNPVFDAIELVKWELDDLYSERKLAEKALRESEEKFRKIVESTPMGIYMYQLEEDGRLVFVDANPATDKILGVDNRQFCGKAIEEAFPSLADTNIPNLYRQICERGKQIRGEHVHYEDDRIEGIFEVNAFQTERNKMAVMFSDITKKKQSEEALRRSEEKYRNILETIEDGYFEVDIKGNLIFFNSTLCKITGYREDELKGMNYRRYASADTADKMIQVFNQIYQTGKPRRNVDFDIDLKDGRSIAIELSASAVKASDGTITGFRGLMRDVTERKKAEEERIRLEIKLQQAQKMKAIGTLAGGVAHDLNNILSGIVSYPELILMDLPQDSPLRDSIRAIQDSGKKAAAIVQDLLTLARRGVSISEVVNLNDIISEYLTSPEFKKLQSFHPLVEITTDLDAALLNIAGSPVHLMKTVMNLVSNAAEAMVDGGILHLKTENRYLDQPIRGHDDINEGDYVVLTVSDSGVGIAAEEINRIFEPFYTKKVMGRSGTGLGMAVVWGTVKDHHGYIHVESELEIGTTFKIYFPITRKERPENPDAPELNDYRGNGESILVVDDVREQREIASKILSQLGYSVKIAASGEEAVELMNDERADLVVLDMIMSPGIDGLETYKRIVSRHPHQKAIIVSGFSETDRVKKAQGLGAGVYVKKPYTIVGIGMAVKTELEKERKAV